LYFHKTVTGFKWLLGQAMDEVLAEPATAAFVGEALRSRSVFQHFTDTYFWECFRSVARRYPGSASARLTSRRRLQCLGVGQNMAAFEVASLKDELAKRYSTSVVEWTSDAKFSKLGQAYSDLRVVVRDPKTGRRELKSVRSQSSFFEKFQGVSVTHFFDSAVSASA
jgi:deoxynucleoside triphosphate triphosphohydrolase SAMHD1